MQIYYNTTFFYGTPVSDSNSSLVLPVTTTLAATLRGSRPGVRSPSLIMTSLMTS